MNLQFVRSFRRVTSINVENLTPDSSKSLAHFCRSLIVEAEAIARPDLKTRVRKRLERQLLAAHKRSKSVAS